MTWRQSRWWWYRPEGDCTYIVPVVRGGVAMDPTIDQNVWARVSDDGDEAGSTIVTESTSDGGWTQDVDTVFRVRFEMVETAGNNATSRTFQLQYNHESGGWTNVTTSAAPIQATVSAETSWTVTDGDATTDRLSGSAGTFSAAEYSEDGLTGAITTQASRHTEVEYCVTIPAAQVANNDTILLRVIMSDAQGTPTYGATPTLTVSEQDIRTGAGSSDGVATPTATGVALWVVDGSSAGVGTPTATGVAEWQSDGAAAGVATGSGAGAGIRYGAGSSNGTSTTPGVGAYLVGGAGASTGVATATATGIAEWQGVGAVTGLAAPTAIGVAEWQSVGASAGVATVTAVGEDIGGAPPSGGYGSRPMLGMGMGA